MKAKKFYTEKILNEFVTEKLRTEKTENPPNFIERITDHVASFGGSWRFIIGFTIFVLGWIMFNLYVYTFDAPPFIMLNLFLSALSVFQAPFILMSQNRMADIDRKEQDNAYKINMKAELEIKYLHEKLDELLKLNKPRKIKYGAFTSQKNI